MAGPAVCDRHPRLDQLTPQPVGQLKIAVLTGLETALLELGDGPLDQLRLRPFELLGRGLQGGQGLMGILLQQAEQTA
jgi:hypothetical protein